MGPSSFLRNDGQGKKGEHNARDASQRGGGGDRDSRDREVAATRISCCLSKFFVQNSGSGNHESVYAGNNYY